MDIDKIYNEWLKNANPKSFKDIFIAGFENCLIYVRDEMKQQIIDDIEKKLRSQ